MANFATNAPFLLTACNHHDKENDGFTLYSPSDKFHLEFDKPFLHGKLFIGSQHDWLIVLDQHCEPTLFNPLTAESMSLPSITTLPKVRPCHSVNSNTVSYFCRTNYRPESPFLDCEFDYCLTEVAFRKVLISSNPSISSSNYFAAALVDPLFPNLVVARSGENRWNLIPLHKEECEISAPFVEDNTAFNMYLAEDFAGRVLVIIRHQDFTTDELVTSDVKVFRLIGGNGEERKWECVENLNGQSIFVGTNASISLAKEDIHGEIKADTIYFTDEWWYFIGSEESKSRPRDICSYNLISKSIKRCCPHEHRRCTWPLPIWIHLSNPTLMLN
ncbi:hypothetical protein LUZ61_005680 [Rhynchospora tenuis]|uniref:KIB1-4 beta-propeller domain-containing protein n=1 Tax=Rhynchospora tenuis TaxID=198213 RepID=A0AAD5ZQ46_9POAL|nr:hypothetical protein LUZ61_005680 [Rhynchospora tenuis]